MKKKGYNGHTGAMEPCRVGEREKNLKSFEKGELNKSRLDFK